MPQNPTENPLLRSLRIMAGLIQILPLVMRVDTPAHIDLRFLRMKRNASCVFLGKAYWIVMTFIKCR